MSRLSLNTNTTANDLVVNTGSAANSKNGDALRTAFTKLNSSIARAEANFIELYASLGGGPLYHLGDDTQFVNIELDGEGVPTGGITIQSGFDTAMPVYIKGGNATQDGVGGNVIIEAGAPPLATPEQLIQGGVVYAGTVGNIEMAANQTTIDSMGNVWTFRDDGVLELPLNGDIVDSDGNTVLGSVGFDGGDLNFTYGGAIFEGGHDLPGRSWRTGLNIVGSQTTSTDPVRIYPAGADSKGLNMGTVNVMSDRVEIQGNNQGTAPGITWTFAHDGTLTFPNGAGFGLGDNGQLKVNDSTTLKLDIRDNSGRGFFTNEYGVTIRSNGDHNFTFGTDGYMVTQSLYLQGYLKGVDGSTGSTGQVLTRQSNGGVAWANATSANPFNQTLNTTSNPQFNDLGINGNISLLANNRISFGIYGRIESLDYNLKLSSINGITLVTNSTNGTPPQWNLSYDGILTLPNNGSINNPTIPGAIITGQSVVLVPNELGQTTSSVTIEKAGLLNTDWALPQIDWTVTVNGTTVTVTNVASDLTNAYFTFDSSITLPVTGDITFNEPNSQEPSTKSLEITPNGTTTWIFGDDGRLELPAGGDIVDSAGETVLGFAASYLSGYNVLSSDPGGITVTGDVTNVFSSGQVIKFSTLTEDEFTVDTVTYDSGNNWTVILLVETLGGPVDTDSIYFEKYNVSEIYPGDGIYATLMNNVLTLGTTGTYYPSTPSDWNNDAPTTITEALDRLAALVKSLNNGTGA